MLVSSTCSYGVQNATSVVRSGNVGRVTGLTATRRSRFSSLIQALRILKLSLTSSGIGVWPMPFMPPLRNDKNIISLAMVMLLRPRHHRADPDARRWRNERLRSAWGQRHPRCRGHAIDRVRGADGREYLCGVRRCVEYEDALAAHGGREGYAVAGGGDDGKLVVGGPQRRCQGPAAACASGDCGVEMHASPGHQLGRVEQLVPGTICHGCSLLDVRPEAALADGVGELHRGNGQQLPA